MAVHIAHHHAIKLGLLHVSERVIVVLEHILETRVLGGNVQSFGGRTYSGIGTCTIPQRTRRLNVDNGRNVCERPQLVADAHHNYELVLVRAVFGTVAHPHR